MSTSSVSKICFWKKSIIAAINQYVLDHIRLPYSENKFGNNQFIFQHDLSPPNIAKSRKEWFSVKKIPVFDWPANNPETNPIENLWEILKSNFKKYYRTSLEELKRVFTEVWALVVRSVALEKEQWQTWGLLLGT